MESRDEAKNFFVVSIGVNGTPKIRVGREIFLFFFCLFNTREVVHNICTPKDIWMQECMHTHTQTSPHIWVRILNDVQLGPDMG